MPFLRNHNNKTPTKAAITSKIAILNGYRPLLVSKLGKSNYTGYWLNGKKTGFGTNNQSNGLIYEGNFLNNLRHGFGSIRKKLSNGEYVNVYAGYWQNNLRHGEGKQFYNNGIYIGDWRNDKRNGLGIFYYDTQSFYVGEWKNDQYHGAGVLFQENGNRYEGLFENGLKHGEGTFYHNFTGQIQKGIWGNGICITSIIQDEFRHQCLKPSPFPILKNELLNGNQIIHDSFRKCSQLIKNIMSTLN